MPILAGRTALVIGASTGIGRAVCEAFAAEGAAVAVADHGHEAERADLAARLHSRGIDAFDLACDVREEAQVAGAIAAALKRFGVVDIVVNNAGVGTGKIALQEQDWADWDRVMAVNLKGVFLGCKYGIPALLRAGGGSIINTASFVAVVGAATSQVAYTASKGGVLAMTREIAVEYARRGIRANALCPGPVNTPLLAELLARPEARARRFVHIPMGRLAEAPEIARAALFLASDESSYVNGSTFLVDGGITAAYVTPE